MFKSVVYNVSKAERDQNQTFIFFIDHHFATIIGLLDNFNIDRSISDLINDRNNHCTLSGNKTLLPGRRSFAGNGAVRSHKRKLNNFRFHADEKDDGYGH